MLKFLKPLILLAILTATPLYAQSSLGRAATPDEIAAWDIDVRPDGLGLPTGAGDVATGEEIFSDTCAACHGDFGEGLGLYPALAGGEGTITGDRPVKSIGSFVPYLSTIFDFINRAKPFGDAQSLSVDETYALVAYLLYLNDIVDDEFSLTDANFNDIHLPNEANFYLDDRATTELPLFSAAPCMKNCKDSVQITGHGMADITPGADPNTIITDTPVALGIDIADPELIAAGEKLFKKCKACHQIGDGAKNRSGPQLNSVFGRAAGSIDGFNYSKAMASAAKDGLIWDEATLTEFLTKPRAYLKGTKMSFAGFKKPEEITAMLAYLDSF